MTDIYVYNELTKDNNGNIKVDAQTGGLSMHTAETPTKVGNLNANYNLGWTNNFTYKGINLGVVLSARVGGLALLSHARCSGLLWRIKYHGKCT